MDSKEISEHEFVAEYLVNRLSALGEVERDGRQLLELGTIAHFLSSIRVDLAADPDKRLFDRSGRPLSILCKLMLHDVKKATLTADFYRPSVAGRIILHGMTGF